MSSDQSSYNFPRTVARTIVILAWILAIIAGGIVFLVVMQEGRPGAPFIGAGCVVVLCAVASLVHLFASLCIAVFDGVDHQANMVRRLTRIEFLNEKRE